MQIAKPTSSSSSSLSAWRSDFANANTPAGTQASIEQILLMLQTGIGMDDPETTLKSLNDIERRLTDMVKNGQMQAAAAFEVGRQIRKHLTSDKVFRKNLEDHVRQQNVSQQLGQAIDEHIRRQAQQKVDNRVREQTARLQAQAVESSALTAVQHIQSAISSGELHSEELLSLREKVEGLDVNEANVLRAAIDQKLKEAVLAGELAFARQAQQWLGFSGSKQEVEARQNILAAQKRGAVEASWNAPTFAQDVQQQIREGQLSLNEVGDLYRGVRDATKRGELATHKRDAVVNSMEAALKNRQGIFDLRPTAPTQLRDSKLLGTLGARVEEAQNSHVFFDADLAKQFVRAFAVEGAATKGQKDALIESLLQGGRVNISDLRAFQLGLDAAVLAKEVSKEHALVAWRAIASEAGKYLGSMSVGDIDRGRQLATHGVARVKA